MQSIRRQLLFWLLGIVVAGVGLAGWLIYRQALAEANELFDYQLQEIAAALGADRASWDDPRDVAIDRSGPSDPTDRD